MVSDDTPQVHILHRESLTIRRWMSGQVIALLPLLIAAVSVYGLVVLLPVAGAVGGAALADLLAGALKRTPGQWRNHSALASGLMLAMLLPPATPFWVALAGGGLAVLLGRELFGGLGRNLLHEVAVGKLLLLLFFNGLMEKTYLQPFWWRPEGWLLSWQLPPGLTALDSGNLATLFHNAVRYLTEITSGESAELALGLPEHISRSAAAFRLIASVPDGQFWLTHAGGLIGESSIFAVLLAFLWLSHRRIFNWELPLLGLLSFSLVGLITGLLNPLSSSNFLYHLASGEFWLVMTLLATDTVTSPVTRQGRLLAGVILGSSAELLIGLLPPGYEPFLLALLLMNLFTPALNLLTMPRGRYHSR